MASRSVCVRLQIKTQNEDMPTRFQPLSASEMGGASDVRASEAGTSAMNLLISILVQVSHSRVRLSSVLNYNVKNNIIQF